MRIISFHDRLVYLPREGYAMIEWHKGSHTANVRDTNGNDIDVFTFAWEKNRPSMLDFTTSLQLHLDYLEA